MHRAGWDPLLPLLSVRGQLETPVVEEFIQAGADLDWKAVAPLCINTFF